MRASTPRRATCRATRRAISRSIDGLPYGEDPSEGYVRGRRFLHPRLAFTFTAPDRFTLENTAQAVLGVRDNGNLALRFDVVRVPAEQTLSQYLGSGWIENVDEKIDRGVRHQRAAAATALAKGDQWIVPPLRDPLRRRGLPLHLRRQADDLGSRPRVPLFGRRPSAAWRRARSSQARPLRLRIVTVTPGDTAERMAGRMPLVDRPLERFLILNGLNQGDALKPGEKVKVVTE